MRTNIYAEELPDPFEEKAMQCVETVVRTDGPEKRKVFFGARLYLKSTPKLHNRPGDDDRSAVTIWGPRKEVATLLRRLADEMESGVSVPK